MSGRPVTATVARTGQRALRGSDRVAVRLLAVGRRSIRGCTWAIAVAAAHRPRLRGAYRPWFLITLELTLLAARQQHAAERLAQARATTFELIGQTVTGVLHAAGREPRGEAVDIADAVVAAFLGWQTQRLAKAPLRPRAATGARRT